MKSPVWVVKEVQPKEDYTLLLTFADGAKKVYNARPLLEKVIYSPLKNLAFFLCAKAECGTRCLKAVLLLLIALLSRDAVKE